MTGGLQERFREAMGRVAAPVSVVTALTGDGQPHGSTVSAFTSLSMDPPMILISLMKTSRVLGVIQASGRFGLNVLGCRDSALAKLFATRWSPEEKFSSVQWSPENGVPRLAAAPGWLACRVEQEIEGGDHVVLFGSVVSLSTSACDPLTYHDHSFGTHTSLARQACSKGDC